MPTSPNHRVRRSVWPISIMAFFTVAVIGCASFVAYCSLHPADLITPEYYEQEMRYQGQLDRIQHVQQQAPLASVTYDPTGNRITISLPPNQSHATATGSIQLYRPSAINLDQQLKLEPDANGVQTIDAASLLPGLWKVRVSWTVDKQDYFLDEKIVVGDPRATAQVQSRTAKH